MDSIRNLRQVMQIFQKDFCQHNGGSVEDRKLDVKVFSFLNL